MKPRPLALGILALATTGCRLALGPGGLLRAEGEVKDGWQKFERKVRDEQISHEKAKKEEITLASDLSMVFTAVCMADQPLLFSPARDSALQIPGMHPFS